MMKKPFSEFLFTTAEKHAQHTLKETQREIGRKKDDFLRQMEMAVVGAGRGICLNRGEGNLAVRRIVEFAVFCRFWVTVKFAIIHFSVFRT